MAEIVDGAVRLTTLDHSLDKGVPAKAVPELVERLRLVVLPLDEALVLPAGAWGRHAPRGAQHGDGACLALARKLGLRAITADRAWGGIADAIGVKMVFVRQRHHGGQRGQGEREF